MVFRRLMEATNLPTFLKFGNAKKSEICVIFAKKSWVAMKLGGWDAKLGLGACAPPSLGLKAPLERGHLNRQCDSLLTQGHSPALRAS